ncbi:hypothetical protein Hanom_Chr10g00880951 [Helianthus anomalus]
MCHFMRIFIFLINPKVKLHITYHVFNERLQTNLSISFPCLQIKENVKNSTCPPTHLSLSSASSSWFPLYHLFSIFSFPFRARVQKTQKQPFCISVSL